MHLIRPLAIRIGAQPWLPKYTKPIVGCDRFLQKISRGHVDLLRIAGLPGLMLTVRGRKTGLPRTTPLLCVPRDDGWLVAGSNWGGTDTPAWARNLRAAESATVDYKGRTVQVSVRIAEGTERDALWDELVATWPNYELYAKRTTRRIPVFVLTPR